MVSFKTSSTDFEVKTTLLSAVDSTRGYPCFIIPHFFKPSDSKVNLYHRLNTIRAFISTLLWRYQVCNKFSGFLVLFLFFYQLHAKFEHLKKTQVDEKKKLEEKRRMLVSVAHFFIFGSCFRNNLCSAIVRAPLNMHNINGMWNRFTELMICIGHL